MRSVNTCGACRRVRGLLFIIALCSVVGVPGSAVWADLQNGDFFNGLDYWANSGEVGHSAGVAELHEDTVGFPYLEQEFTIPAGIIGLSFDYKPSLVGEESFTASLLDPYTYEPLILTDDKYPPDGLLDGFYFMYDWQDGGVLNSPSVKANPFDDGWQTVILDLTGLTLPANALIAFDFVGNGGDGTVLLDNVSLLVPAPAAVVLFVLGMGTAGTMLRRRTHQRS